MRYDSDIASQGPGEKSMATVVDYLSWRGDLSFVERPFNEVDALILSTLSYLDFTGVAATGAGSVTVSIHDFERS